MVDKLHDYQGPVGQLHTLRDNIKTSWENWKEKKDQVTIPDLVRKLTPNPNEKYYGTSSDQNKNEKAPTKYDFIYRKKTKLELVRLSAAVCGIEFSYAAITAFVSPILLSIGASYEVMTMSWSISPIIGLFLSPILGTLSDNCKLRYGRRRPFIILLSIPVVLGLTLISNGKLIASLIAGDDSTSVSSYATTNSTTEPTEPSNNASSSRLQAWTIALTMIGLAITDFSSDALQSPSRAYLLDLCTKDEESQGLSTFTLLAGAGGSIGYFMGSIDWEENAMGAALGGQTHAVFTIFTVIFIICILITITTFPEIPLQELEHYEMKCEAAEQGDKENFDRKGSIKSTTASTTTTTGYYEVAQTGSPQHHSAVTVKTEQDASRSTVIDDPNALTPKDSMDIQLNTIEGDRNSVTKGYQIIDKNGGNYASRQSLSKLIETPHVSSKEPLISSSHEGLQSTSIEMDENKKLPSLKDYLLSIVQMPYSLKILYLTNLLCWMSHVSYSLYFTDFVGETVFEGNPKAPPGSETRDLYQTGVRYACLGMSVYSLSCLFNSFLLDFFLKRFGLKTVYTANLLIDSLSQIILFILNDKICVIVLSWASGVLYCTIFTLPYMIIAQYHTYNAFEVDSQGNPIQSKQIRGLGTDVAIIGSCVFPAQFILSMCMGKLMHLFSARVVPLCSSVVAFLAAILSAKVIYF